ncbi:MAG TPA: alpha/beta hydrolase [Acidimicrobiales bacterium]|nr:alpha/beta hydrolase [Acidimicrobiales bacterium]
MPRAAANGIELEYETFGSPTDPALLLVMGLGGQLIAWEDAFCRRLADTGRYVVRYDNRDVGLSTHFDDADIDLGTVLASALAGGPRPPVPYTLSDMAADAVGLLDALHVERAHIVGASMGGMIVQTMAIEHPERVLTMTSIMSTTGEEGVGQPSPEAIQVLLSPPPADRAEAIDGAVEGWKMIGSPRYIDEERVRQRAAEAFDRSFYPAGTNRQLAAVVASGSRADGLRRLRIPTLVIHGRADSLIQLSGGERTAELVPGANLLVMNDMGHDLPEPLWPLVVDAIASHTTHAI